MADQTVKWVRISVLTTAAAAEGAVEVLLRVGRGAVEERDRKNDDIVNISTYVPADDGVGARVDSIRQRLDAMRDAGIDVGPGQVKVDAVPGYEWEEAWRAHFRITHLPGGLVIAPTWEDYHPQQGEVVVRLDPGMAFGTGGHPTTRQSLVALAKWLAPGDVVIDVGTGSGILAIAVAKLGASTVIALEQDEVALAVARENVQRNGVADRVTLLNSDLLEKASVRANVITANITAAAIERMAPDIPRCLKRDGILIASGATEPDISRAEAALADVGIWTLERLEEDSWVTLVGEFSSAQNP